MLSKNGLEWSWGLEHKKLNEHLQLFAAAEDMELLTDERVYVSPHTTDIRRIYFGKRPLRTLDFPNITTLYAGAQKFRYFVIPFDPSSSILPRRVELKTPPHIVLIRSTAKLMRAYHGAPMLHDPIGSALADRIREATEHDRFPLGAGTLQFMRSLYWRFTHMNHVHPSFRSNHSDDERVVEATPAPAFALIRPTSKPLPILGGKITFGPEPQRRVTASELGQDFNEPVDTIEAEEDSGSEAEDNSSPTWARDVEKWAQTTEQAAERDEKMLINDINSDWQEGTRTVTSVDLAMPDYLTRSSTQLHSTSA
ncbi:hypothetical protein MIND_01205000 [Mycena indigotica]|uniref:Uncharacterized protein n=1 Tax=Mycena indigotica TaxID=2126181 RepID=A0A8H6VV35_9AGAR|nr:uncharacterized protein MIND_01205000 [Mycena indigotica]KAF7293056.1 hypothetical protein MIND_01205000 [Mycena indigotica]